MHRASIQQSFLYIYRYTIEGDGTVRQLFTTLCKRIDIIIQNNIIIHTGCVFPDMYKRL